MSQALRVTENFAGKGDDFYSALLAAHEGLTDRQSALLHTRVLLLLSNHIGELSVLEEALSLARASVLRDKEVM
jgi:hypothetical protein